jgi:hypothetical protein
MGVVEEHAVGSAGEPRQSGASLTVGDAIGRFYTWWRSDALPPLPVIPSLAIEPVDAVRLCAAFSGVDAGEVRQRERQGHHPYLALLDGAPAAYGWSAVGAAAIGELGATLALAPGERYLYDFLTLPPLRGRGIYPRLLQAILTEEAAVERFWIGHDIPNLASARGIVKAGFQQVVLAYHLPGGRVGLVPCGPGARAAEAAAVLGMPLVPAAMRGG